MFTQSFLHLFLGIRIYVELAWWSQVSQKSNQCSSFACDRDALTNFAFIYLFCISLKMFTVQLTLGEQTWEAEGSSIKKAHHSAASKALSESILPKPTLRPPKNNVNNNPGKLVFDSLQ